MKKIYIIYIVSIALLVVLSTFANAHQTKRVSWDTGDDTQTAIIGIANWYAQQFTTTGSFHLTNLSLLLYRTSSPWLCNVSIRLTDISNKPTGSDLCFSQVNVSSISTGSPYTWVNFDFTNPIVLSNNVKYYIVVRCTHTSATNKLNWRMDTSTGYSGGLSTSSTNYGSTWGLYSLVNDYMFRVYGRTVNMSISNCIPSDSVEYPYYNIGFGAYAYYNLSFIHNQSSDFVIHPYIYFENELIFDTGALFISNGTFNNNLMNWLYGWDGELINGNSYTWTINLSATGGFNRWLNTTIEFTFIDMSMMPLPMGVSQNWNLVSLPRNETIPFTSMRIRNDTYNYTWQQAITNNIIVGTLYGWFQDQYCINTSFEQYHGYWIYFYDTSYELFVTKYIKPDYTITLYENLLNTIGTHEYNLISNNYNVYANYTGVPTTPILYHLSINLSGIVGFINWTGSLNSTDSNITVNVTSNMSITGNVDVNGTGVWIYLGAMLSLDNGQFFLLILVGLWTYFIYLFYKEKEVIFAFAIICCGLPLAIILSGVAYYNSYPFGYLISFIIVLISFLIPTYSMYQKNKKKNKN